MAVEAQVLAYYDVTKPVTLTVDSSSKGLGAAILQHGQPVAFGSCALNATQQKYAQIEKEMLVIVFGCQKFHQYLSGRTVEVQTDHKPLESIFKKNLHEAPMRLQRMLLQLQSYDLKVYYVPGKKMYIADALSHSFLPETNESLMSDIEVNMMNYLPMTAEKYAEFQKFTAEDETLRKLQTVCQDGWPQNKEQVDPELRVYWPFREEVSSMDGLLYKGHKIIVPTKLRSDMLHRIHESHLGVVKCKQRAREVLYWPGMTTQIEEVVAVCSVCATYNRANMREPMMETECPDRPWVKVGVDLFEFGGSHYIVCVDYYSKWPEIAKLDSLTSRKTIYRLKSVFARFGIPDEVRSDNGPQFSASEFKEFAKDYGFDHTTSSPYFPQSNGEAERAVQTIKQMLRKCTDPHKALLAYRNTPLEIINLSSAQLLQNRMLKTTLPTAVSLLRM